MMSTSVSFIVLSLFTCALLILGYYSWFDYKKIPPFLGKMFPKGPINHQKWAATKPGEWYLKLFSLFGLLLMIWTMIVGIGQALKLEQDYFIAKVSYSSKPDCNGIGEIKGKIVGYRFSKSTRVQITPVGGDYLSTVDAERTSDTEYFWTDLPMKKENYTVELMQTHGLRSEVATVSWDPKDCSDNIITVDFIKE